MSSPASEQLSPITSVLVANRGEIACRVFATCRRRGIRTVAVFSDADADSPHVTQADAAVRLPGNAPAETYLRGDLIIAAAHRAGADAVHPGYGFLSENAEFAEDVRAAGLTWIGPEPAAIRIMGSKVDSKTRMAAAGVPVLDRLKPAELTAAHLPVLVKASSGGGGRGMRVVRTLEEVDGAIEAASREAASAFGDPTVFVERYLESGHHVEVQIMADTHGTVWALGERECSLQRRHQKVIEEAPSPLVEHVGPAMRDRLLNAGRDAAAAVGYRGAGTVEFLALPDGSFWFLEMNTRLQVEHPVTEAVTGTDLVGLQLDVAEGRALPGEEPTPAGWSIEARLYAEDPEDDWRPQTGTLTCVEIPGVTSEFAVPADHGLRLDAGVTDGSVIGTHYDAMLAKLVSRAPTRQEAARELAAALQRSRIHGVTTNRDLLVASLTHPEFLDGLADTGFYDRHAPAALTAGSSLDPDLTALVASLAASAQAAADRPALRAVRSGFRNVSSAVTRRSYALGERIVEVGHRHLRDGVEPLDLPPGVERLEVVVASPSAVTLEVDGVRRSFAVTRLQDEHDHVVVDSPQGSCTLRRVPRFVDPSLATPAGALVAQTPGSVVRVEVSLGDTVEVGQPLVYLEAMKMEHPVLAPSAGIVTELSVTVGQQVDQGTVLAVVETDQDDTAAAGHGTTNGSEV